MSSTNKTANLQLNQWVGTDPVLMADFNADNAKLDAAIAALQSGMPRVAVGSYTGDGSGPKTLSFAFEPKVFLLTRDTSQAVYVGIIAMRGQSYCYNARTFGDVLGYVTKLSWSGNRVTLTSASMNGITNTSDSAGAFNASGEHYHWLVIG